MVAPDVVIGNAGSVLGRQYPVSLTVIFVTPETPANP
jgi:hypothetical protein